MGGVYLPDPAGTLAAALGATSTADVFVLDAGRTVVYRGAVDDRYGPGFSKGAATKTYRCPGCDHEVPPGMAHVVAWPADDADGLQDRRHWHTGCWRARDRRAPTVERSRNAPRYG